MTHTDDGALVRLLDGACDGEERSLVTLHLETCGSCGARYQELDRRTRLVSESLRVWDTSVRPRRRGIPRWLRAAAAIVILLGIAGGVRPVRAWIVDGARAVWTAVVGPPASQVVQQDASSTSVPAATVTFVPAGDTFVLELTSRQREGTLLLATSSRETAQAEISGGAGREDLVVLPTGLRVVNDAASVASYAITLPRTMRAIRVVIDGEPALALEPGGATSRWEIDLTSVVDTARAVSKGGDGSFPQ